MPTRVNYEGATRKMLALGNVLKRPMQDVLDSGARVCATECARASTPFGTGNSAKQAGEGAVARDIARVYATLGHAYEDITPARMQSAFWINIKAGHYDQAQRILDEFGDRLKGVPIRSTWDGGIAHRTNQDHAGHVRLRRPVVVMADSRGLERYVQREKDRVGSGKGAWADVVRALGGKPRGLREEGDITANWITRKGKGYGKAFKSGTETNPAVTIENRIQSIAGGVRYASEILSGSTLENARRIARNRMIKNLEIAVKYEAARLKSG